MDLTPFQRSLPALEFAQLAFTQFESIPEDQVRQPPDSTVKAFLEEVIPLATLAKHMVLPGRRVECRHVGGSGNHDGVLTFQGEEADSGSLPRHVYVEITRACHSKEYLVAEALNTDGHVSVDPDIHRDPKTRAVVSQPTVRDGGSARSDVLDWIRARLTAKISKPYPSPCWLLIDPIPQGVLDYTDWIKIIGELAHEVRKQSTFHAVHIVTGTLHLCVRAERTSITSEGFSITSTV